MTNRLFVYGTLMPGRPNEHILTAIGGEFIPAHLRGTLYEKGWGADMGYPGLIIDQKGDKVNGYIFSSTNLKYRWKDLDEFEGNAYLRVLTDVTMEDGSTVKAYVYTIRS